MKVILQSIKSFQSSLYRALFKFGLRTGLILPYEEQLIERLRPINFGGLPASVVLLIQKLCNGQCYDRAAMLSAGLDNFELVYGSVRSIRLTSDMTDHRSSDHCWVESDTWVYDTSICLRVKKWFYYLLECPVVRRRENQDWCRQQEVYQEILQDNLERDKFYLVFIIPLIETHINDQCIYKDQVIRELSLIKEKVNYNCLYDEMKTEMMAMGIS